MVTNNKLFFLLVAVQEKREKEKRKKKKEKRKRKRKRKRKGGGQRINNGSKSLTFPCTCSLHILYVLRCQEELLIRKL